jgi:hypothetical protein
MAGSSLLRAADVTLGWDPNPDPPVIGGSPTAGYNIYGTSPLGTTSKLGTVSGVNNTTIKLTNLANGGWKFWATAYGTNSSESLPSNIITYGLLAVPTAPVIGPVNVFYASAGLYSAYFSWSLAASQSITNYSVTLVRPDGLTDRANTTNTTWKATPIPAGDYTFSVQAQNASGPGPVGTSAFKIFFVGQPKNVHVIAQ